MMQTLPSPVVSADWLAQNRDQVRIVDVRWSIPTGPKRAEYEAGHIPGAVFADLDRDLSSPAGAAGRHPLPTPEAFAEVRGTLGMDLPVVAYDDCSGAVAGRLWWMLDALGAEAAVLDGGIQVWKGELTSGVESVTPAVGAPLPWPRERFIEAGSIPTELAAGAALLDARTADRFAGVPNPIDTVPGRIPGSVSRPWQSNIGEDGRFLSASALNAAFAELGVTEKTDLIGSCGSGVTGCHNLLAARLAGLGNGRLYTGSWSEWSNDPERPVEKG